MLLLPALDVSLKLIVPELEMLVPLPALLEFSNCNVPRLPIATMPVAALMPAPVKVSEPKLMKE